MAPEPIAVLVMAYGTPRSRDEVEAYYTDIRRGRPPTPELLADLLRRYDAIGGISPLAARTAAQVAGLQTVLDQTAPGRYRVFHGNRHAAPFIEDAIDEIVAGGFGDVVALVLAPHYSALSVGQYFERVATAFDDRDRPVAVTYVQDWHLEPGLVDLLADRLREAHARFPGGADVETLVTAHSLPSRVIEMGDPYPDQLRQTAEAITAAAGVSPWRLAWQSAGRTQEPWLGPDILEVIRGLGAEGRDGVVVCPAGFVSDHLEVLYDIDIEARRAAEEAGMRLERTASLNDDPAFLGMLAAVVTGALS